MRTEVLVGVVVIALTGAMACSDEDGPETADGAASGEDGSGDTGSAADGAGEGNAEQALTACPGSEHAGSLICSGWQLNGSEVAPHLTNADGSPVLVDVQSVTVESVAGEDFVVVQTTGIPSYRHTVTQAEVDALANRPQAATDFVGGSPTVSAGDVVDFGQDIGFSSNPSCSDVGGYGWWPPGPRCPTDQGRTAAFPVTPVPATETCYVPLGAVGLMVNGVSIYGWSDGGSFGDGGVWHNLAQKLEIYDLDLCLGHAQLAGDYHQHLDSPCIAEELGDDGAAHSPVYGFAADGYPVYGPWHEAGVRAESCWKARDYDDPTSLTGCGASGERTCQLVDPTNPSAGTFEVEGGPTTSESVTSFSGNAFDAVSGLYLEDYWFDAECAAQGGRFLDQHNGHDHDGLGYHYHVTDSFPYNVGPAFYGKLHSNSLLSCSSSRVPMTGPGGGGPGGGGPGGG